MLEFIYFIIYVYFHTGIHPRDDINNEMTKHELLKTALPSIFTAFPLHKQKKPSEKRPPPKKRGSSNDIPQPPEKRTSSSGSADLGLEHNYASARSPAAVEEELKQTKQKLEDARKELKGLKQKVKRKEAKIASLLEVVKEKNMLNQGQLDLLKLNFGEQTFTLIENELNTLDKDKHGLRYSEQLKQFAVTLHFYSAQAYDFLREYLTLPHPATIRKWAASIDCHPGFMTEVINHLKSMVQENELNKHCTLMLDAMALKKEVVFDPKTGGYSGFVDCGHLQSSCGDSLATEALVFMVVGLTGHWKYPVAYYLVDHLPGSVQAEIIKQLICVLTTEAGLDVHGVVCDGSYANQATASLLGCSIFPGTLQAYFQHPSDPTKRVHFIFDACHLIKLVRNCLGTADIYHEGERISWSYIQKLHDIQQNDNLNLANKLKAKHILWQNHKMNVKVAVQALSTSVADAIDFLRDDLHLPEFAGSEKTTEFIRRVDKLFDFMNSKSPHAKGFKKPMNKYNFDYRKKWLLETKEYLRKLEDATGMPLTMGRRKTAWIGFMTTIESVIAICQDLLNLPTPFRYVCTFKVSQDHLEMFFSRVRRRGGWNNNPNCLQFKWAIRAILLRNCIKPSKNANVVVDEPLNNLFQQKTSASISHTNQNMQKFAKLLSEPSVFHEHILHYMAGYITRHVTEDCNCTQCCVALHKNTMSETSTQPASSLTIRKDRGGLIKPREDVFKIVKTTDQIFRYTAGQRCIGLKKNYWGFPDEIAIPH
jgi:hypothetical protein